MYIKNLILRGFRNYIDIKATFTEGLNVVVGKNAMGKTNLVESIYFAALGKSPRATRDKEMINWESVSGYIHIDIAKKYRYYSLDITIEQKTKKLYVDRLPVTKVNDLLGIVNISYFSPDELAIIKESPQERRRFIDIAISQHKKSYFSDLVAYNRIINQRNKLLKTYKNSQIIKEAIKVWDMQLAKTGARVIDARYTFVDQLAEIAKSEHSYLTQSQELLTIKYESKINRGSLIEMEKEFLELLNNSIDKDIQLQYTTIGSHRDDMDITLNYIDLRKYGSQGQKRTAALALKLSELTIIERATGEKPILILDDVLSELDPARQEKLLERARANQTILTCTSFDGEYDNLLLIEQGKITQKTITK